MRCNNCGYKLSKDWKVCPKCANEVILSNLPFKAKNKTWVDKHLILVNVIYGFPFNALYTFLPAFLLYLYVGQNGTSGDALTIDNVFSILVSLSALYPFLIVLLLLLFAKAMVKSFKMIKYAVKTTNDKRYYLFTVSNIVGIVLLVTCVLYFVI